MATAAACRRRRLPRDTSRSRGQVATRGAGSLVPCTGADWNASDARRARGLARGAGGDARGRADARDRGLPPGVRSPARPRTAPERWRPAGAPWRAARTAAHATRSQPPSRAGAAPRCSRSARAADRRRERSPWRTGRMRPAMATARRPDDDVRADARLRTRRRAGNRPSAVPSIRASRRRLRRTRRTRGPSAPSRDTNTRRPRST